MSGPVYRDLRRNLEAAMNYTKDLSEDWAEMIEDFNSKSELVLVVAVLVIMVIMGGFVLALHWGWFR